MVLCPTELSVLFGSFSEIPGCYVSIGHDWFISSSLHPRTELLTPLTLNQAAVRDRYPILTHSVKTILIVSSISSVFQVADLKLGSLPKRFIERPVSPLCKPSECPSHVKISLWYLVVKHLYFMPCWWLPQWWQWSALWRQVAGWYIPTFQRNLLS